ncbi:MAG: MoaD/ThiS family protein [Thermoprotei archaeon]
MNINEITIKIEYYGVIGALAGTKHEIIQIPENSTLKNLLEKLVKTKNASFKERLFKNNEIESDIIILINKVDYRLLQYLSTPLKNNDTITIISVVHGG